MADNNNASQVFRLIINFKIIKTTTNKIVILP